MSGLVANSFADEFKRVNDEIKRVFDELLFLRQCFDVLESFSDYIHKILKLKTVLKQFNQLSDKDMDALQELDTKFNSLIDEYKHKTLTKKWRSEGQRESANDTIDETLCVNNNIVNTSAEPEVMADKDVNEMTSKCDENVAKVLKQTTTIEEIPQQPVVDTDPLNMDAVDDLDVIVVEDSDTDSADTIIDNQFSASIESMDEEMIVADVDDDNQLPDDEITILNDVISNECYYKCLMTSGSNSCGQLFGTSQALKTHISTEHSPKNGLSKSLTTRQSSKSTIVSSNTASVVQQISSSRTSLPSSSTNPKSGAIQVIYKCPQINCNEWFVTKALYDIHLKTHLLSKNQTSSKKVTQSASSGRPRGRPPSAASKPSDLSDGNRIILTAAATPKCPVDGCNKHFVSQDYLSAHMKTGHSLVSIKVYKCTYDNCLVRSTEKAAVIKHIQNDHKLIPILKCQSIHCKQLVFENDAQLQRHVQRFHLIDKSPNTGIRSAGKPAIRGRGRGRAK